MSEILHNTDQSPHCHLQLDAKLFNLQKFNEQLTPEILFSAIADLPWAIWLDSSFDNQSSNKHVDSNFDILVWQPHTTLTTHGQKTQIETITSSLNKGSLKVDSSKSEVTISQDDPLTLVKQYQQSIFQHFTTNSQLQALPFQGGAVGYFAYDLGRRFEQLPNKAQQDISLPEMAVGIYQQAIIFDHQEKTCTLLCLESERNKIETWFDDKLMAFHNKNLPNFILQSSWQSNMSKNAYADKFQQVQDYLLSGDCYQINLAQRFSAKYQGDEFQAYLALRSNNSAPFSAFMRFEEAAILSVSPERFLQLKQDKVQSKPIKGTRPRHDNSDIDKANAQVLRHSAKDQAENVMIVDLLRNDISKVCIPGSVKVPKLFDIESFPAVHHLVSTVEGQLAQAFDGSDLLRAAFPGGSITGAPKIRAMEIIESLEPHRRSVYCGSVGYLSNCGNMDTSITIRTLVCENNTIHCWAGGGLVADSEVASEYQETYDKVNKIIPILSKLNTIK
jgi:para-aminobenzoate synthetase component 1